jgi:flagellar hook-associated protein 2
MTLGGIQFGGLASGLDTSAIIDAILAVEGRTKRVLEGRKSDEQEKLTLLGTFQGLVEKLQDQARDLQTASNFFAHELTVGEEGFASFTLGGSAEAGAHTLEVLSLAAADRYAFLGVADPAATGLGTGTVSFTYGGTPYSVSVAAGSDSLNGIAAAINAAAGDDVTASVVNAGTASSPSWQLVLAGDDTGADFAITGLTSSVAGLTGATQVSAASNASVLVDGLAVQRSSNLFADVLPGVSFTVSRKTTVGAPLSFTIELDPEGMRTKLQEFVDAYNEVIEFVGDQNTFTLEGGSGGPLFGENALEAVRSALRRAVLEADRTLVAADTEGYSTLGLIGIELEADGTLAIDDEKLDEKLAADLDAFSDFFRRADDESTATVDERGIFVKLEEMLDDLIDDSTALDGVTRIDGLFDARRASIGRQIRDFDAQIESQERRLESLEQSLVAKFSALEKILSSLQSQSAFLQSSLQQRSSFR